MNNDEHQKHLRDTQRIMDLVVHKTVVRSNVSMFADRFEVMLVLCRQEGDDMDVHENLEFIIPRGGAILHHRGTKSVYVGWGKEEATG